MNYIQQLLNKSIKTIAVIAAVFLVYVFMMKFINHSDSWVLFVVALLSFVKVVYFTFFTLKQMQTVLNYCKSIVEILLIFGLLVTLISFSFAIDFTCLATIDNQAFSGLISRSNHSFESELFEYFYLSIITFTSLGYGDIVPLSIAAKFLVMAEVLQSYLLFIFGISNVKTIHTKIN